MFSPDGAFVAGNDGSTTQNGRWILSRSRLSTGRTSTVATFPSLRSASFAWSPDGRRLAVDWQSRSGGGARISVVRADGSGAPRLVLTSGRTSVAFVDLGWRADTGELAVLMDRQLVFVEVDGSGARTLQGPCSFEAPSLPVCPRGPDFSELDFSPDGSSAVVSRPIDEALATVTDDGTGEVIPLRDDAGVQLTGTSALWSPDGTTIAFLSNDPDATGLAAVAAEGGPVGYLPGNRPWEMDDWQPCPGGECPLPPRASSPVAVTADRDATSIHVTGELAFALELEGQPVTLRLRRWSGTRWVTLDRTTTVARRVRGFRATFARPEPGRCRVTVRYAGEEFFYLPSTDRDDLRC